MLHKKDIRSAFSKIIKTTVAKVFSEPGGRWSVVARRFPFIFFLFFFFPSCLVLMLKTVGKKRTTAGGGGSGGRRGRDKCNVTKVFFFPKSLCGFSFLSVEGSTCLGVVPREIPSGKRKEHTHIITSLCNSLITKRWMHYRHEDESAALRNEGEKERGAEERSSLFFTRNVYICTYMHIYMYIHIRSFWWSGGTGEKCYIMRLINL